MDCDGQFGTLLDLRDCFGRDSSLGLLADINVTRQFRATTFIDDIVGDLRVADNGCVLLARVDGDTIAGYVWVDFKHSYQLVRLRVDTGPSAYL